MYRLIAADLDETLLDSGHHVPERVRAAISAARRLGARFVPATGRPFASVAGTLDELGLLGAPGEYVLSFNGGVITENSRSKPLTSCGLDPQRAEELYAFGARHGFCMHLYTLDHVYVRNYLSEERAYIGGRMNIVETDEKDLGFLAQTGEHVVKLLFMSLDMDLLHSTADHLAGLGLTEGLEVVYSSNRYLEFNAPGVSKGVGLLELARMLGIPPEETMAIGDSSNDIPMIRAAGLGVAVANATDETKAAADYVCRENNDVGGVAEAIERFVLRA